jgi:membrane protein DedA with SNARE-associated domain
MDYIVDFLIDYANGPIPYTGIFLILLGCGLGVPVPEDITLIAAGILTYYGICNVWIMIAVALVGVLVGDSFVFYLGRHFGRKLLKRWPFRLFIEEKKIESIRVRLHAHRGKLLFSARFMPGVRSTVFFVSGLLHIPYPKLLVYDGMAAMVSVPTIIYSVYYFGDYIEYVVRLIKKVEGGIAGLIAAIVLVFLVRYILKKRKLARGGDPSEI